MRSKKIVELKHWNSPTLSIQFKQHHTLDYLQKPVTYFWEMNWSMYVTEHISAIRMKSPCVIVHKQDSHNAK